VHTRDGLDNGWERVIYFIVWCC